MYKSSINSFKEFIEPISALINIQNEADYQKANDFIEEVINESEDKEGENLNSLIDILAKAIELYEEKDTELMQLLASNE